MLGVAKGKGQRSTYIRSGLSQNSMNQSTHNVISLNLIESSEWLERKVKNASPPPIHFISTHSPDPSQPGRKIKGLTILHISRYPPYIWP